MIPIKNAKEIETMRKAGKILGEVLYTLIEELKPGISELELDYRAEQLIKAKGGYPGFKKVQGYKNTLCLSVNDVVVHGIPTNRKLEQGDILGIDCGVYLDGLHTDMAETVYVGDKNSMPGEIKRFLETGKQAMFAGIAQVKNGNRVGQISRAIQKKVETEGGYSVTRSLIGHGVGKELHEEPEVPGYLFDPVKTTPLLKSGMTIAVEVIYNMGAPEVEYSGKDGWTIKSKDGSLSGLFERTVLVTQSGYEILTEK